MTQKSYFGEPAIGVWDTDAFYAAAFRVGDVTRLDVVRKDLRGGMTWDELREVKKACGFADKDAAEYYPAEADVINTGNVRHLFIFDTKIPHVVRPA